MVTVRSPKFTIKKGKKQIIKSKVYHTFNTYFKEFNTHDVIIWHPSNGHYFQHSTAKKKLVATRDLKVVIYQGQVIDQREEARQTFPTVALQQRIKLTNQQAPKRDTDPTIKKTPPNRHTKIRDESRHGTWSRQTQLTYF